LVKVIGHGFWSWALVIGFAQGHWVLVLVLVLIMGIEVKGWGLGLTEALKDGIKVLSI